MNKNILRLLALGLVLSAGAVRAVEIRSPMLSEQGPLRHITHENPKDSQWTTWSAGYGREAHAAFKEHSFNAHSLASLVFNKDNFKMSEVFPNCAVPLLSENYNPFLKTARLVPNIRYTEQGLMLGAQWSTEGLGGRWGVRGSVSFRTIEQDSLQDIYGNGSRVEDIVIKTTPRILQDNNAGATEKVAYTQPITAIRYDLAEAGFLDSTRKSYLNMNPGGTDFKVGPAAEQSTATKFNYGFVYNPGKPVYPPQLGGFSGNGTGGGANPSIVAALKTLPLSEAQLAQDTIYYIPRDNSGVLLAPYLDFITPQGNSSPSTDLAYQQMKEGLWIVQSIDNLAPGDDILGADYNRYIETSLVVGLEDWLLERGFKFEDARRAGLGDLPIELFYQNQLEDDLLGELCLGVRFPTGTNANYEYNPLIPKTGNGGHVEIKLGGMLAWQASEMISVKGDVSYSIAVKAKEQRYAAFQGANIKNIGPRADADISWGYFVGHLDLNFFHPETRDYSAVIGYELYVKGKDRVTFKAPTMQSWLGGVIDPATYAVSANNQLLDNDLAAKHTNAIGHKIRFESSYRFSEWVEMFVGGSYTFAGKNLPRETDGHAGLHLTF